MKREIKFRAWEKTEKKMGVVEVLTDQGCFILGVNPDKDSYFNGGKTIIEAPNNGRFVYFEDCELMQFTGLKDKQGKEIYEGDILKSESWGKNTKVKNPYHVVEWGRVGWIAIVYNGQMKVNPPLDVKSDFEIIGNIYENPELLNT